MRCHLGIPTTSAQLSGTLGRHQTTKKQGCPDATGGGPQAGLHPQQLPFEDIAETGMKSAKKRATLQNSLWLAGHAGAPCWIGGPQCRAMDHLYNIRKEHGPYIAGKTPVQCSHGLPPGQAADRREQDRGNHSLEEIKRHSSKCCSSWVKK